MAIVNDETSRILAEYGTPEKWRQYVTWEAERKYRETIDAAYGACRAARGDLTASSGYGRPGEPAYDALFSALEAATLEYDQTCGAIQGEYTRVTT